MADADHDGASAEELLIEACRRNNTELLADVLGGRSEDEISKLLNETTTVMGNHLYHEAASRGHYEIIDMLLDQPNFECDPVNRAEGDTPLHTVIRWINSEPPAQREYGNSLVEMMLEAGSNQRMRNKGRLTPLQLVDPRNQPLRELIQRHEYAQLNAGDFVDADEDSAKKSDKSKKQQAAAAAAAPAGDDDDDDDDDDAEFSGSDEEERAEWERRRKAKKGGR